MNASWLETLPTPILLIHTHTDGQTHADDKGDKGRETDVAEATEATATSAAAPSSSSACTAIAAASSDVAIAHPAAAATASAWRCTFINRAARRLTGLVDAVDSSAAAAAFSARIHPADRSAPMLRGDSTDASTAEGDGGWHCSFRMQLADGSFARVQLQANPAPADSAAVSSTAEATWIASLQLLTTPPPSAPVSAAAAASAHRRSPSLSSQHVLTSPSFPRGSSSPATAAGMFRFPEEASVPVSRGSNSPPVTAATTSPQQLNASPQQLPPPHPTVPAAVAAPSSVVPPLSSFSLDVSVDAPPVQQSGSSPLCVSRGVSDSSGSSGSRPPITPVMVPFAPSLEHASAMTISTTRALSVTPMQLSTEMELNLADDMWRSLPVILMLVHGSRIVRVSPKFTQIFGWTCDEVRSMHVSQLFHPEDLANISLESVRVTGNAYEQEMVADTMSPWDASTEADPAGQSTDTVVINRLRHKYTGEYVACMFRTALSRRFFAVPATAGPLGVSRNSTPRAAETGGTVLPQVAEMGREASASAAATPMASSSLESLSHLPRLSPPASPAICSASPASSPASTPVAEPYIHALIRPMYKQERAALSNALEGIAQSKAAFISNITHELQTPMNGIVASAEMLGETELSAEQTDYLNCIQISAEHMSTIIGDIVSFASIDSGSLQLERAPVHINAVIEEAITLVFRPRLHDHLEIMHPLAPDLPSVVLGDSARIRQILTHLLSNALKFTRRGEVVIRASRYDGSSSPANLIRKQTAHLQALADELSSGRMDPEAAAAAEAELNAPQMLVIQPPQTLPSLYNSNQQPQLPQDYPMPSPPLPVAPLPAPALALASAPSLSPPSDHEHDGASPVSAVVDSGHSVATGSSSPSSPSPASAGVADAASPRSADDRSPFLLQFAISDTGCGIDPRHATRLFQIFSQADSSSSKEHQGTGIGLLTSLKLCRAQGGEVWCSSVTGRGSTFYFTVMCTPAAPVAQLTPLCTSATLQTLSNNSGPVSATPVPSESSLSLVPVSASSAAPPPPSQPTVLPTHATPLDRVRHLVEQETSMHRRSSSASSSSSSAAPPVPASFDSPGGSSTASTNSPHRSPLVFPRFIPSFQTMCVVHANSTVLAIVADDLRSRGAIVLRTFTSPAQALAFAQSRSLSEPAIDCWIIDSLSGTALRDASAPGLEFHTLPSDISGVELVARLLELREARDRARSTSALRSDKLSFSECEVRVVLIVQSFGLPPQLPLPDSVLTSPFIRLIQVHKPFKYQVFYDAIRTLGEQLNLALSPVQRINNMRLSGRNSLDRSAPGSLGSTNSGLGSSSGSGYAMSLTQAKSRRTLTLAMHIGSGPGAASVSGPGDGGGSSTQHWATRRVPIHQNQSQRGSSASSGRSIGSERDLTSSAPAYSDSPLHPRSGALSLDAHEAFVPTSHYTGNNSSRSGSGSSGASLNSTLLSPILPPSPFVHQRGPFPSSSDSVLKLAPAVVLPLPRPQPSSTRRSPGDKEPAGSVATAVGAAATAGASAGPAAPPAVPRPPSHQSPHISTGSSRLRGTTNFAASSSASAGSAAVDSSAAATGGAPDGSLILAHKYPLRILCVDDVAINLKICLKILTKLGYTADSAVDGLEAHTKVIAAAREAKVAAERGVSLPAGSGAYDLVFLDLQMPLCDGFEAAEVIMRAFGCCNLPVSGSRCVHHMQSIADSCCATLPSAVADHKASTGCCSSAPVLTASAPDLAGIPRPVLFALTANTTEDDRSRCFKVGFDGFIAKPITIKAIVEPLKTWAKAISKQRTTMRNLSTQPMGPENAAESTSSNVALSSPQAPSAHPASRRTLSVETSGPHRRTPSVGLLSPTAELGRNGEEIEMPSPNASSTSPSESAPAASPQRRPSLNAMKSLDVLRQMDLSSSASRSHESSPQVRPRAIQRGATHAREASDGLTSWELDRSHPVPPPTASQPFSLLPPLSPRAAPRPASVAASSSSSSAAATSTALVPVPQSSSARQLSRHLPPSSRVRSSQKSPLLLHRRAAPSPPATLVESLYLSPALSRVDPPTEGPLATRVRVSPPLVRGKPTMASTMQAGAHAGADTGGAESPASRMQQQRAASDAPSAAAAAGTSAAGSSASASPPTAAIAVASSVCPPSGVVSVSSPPRQAAHKQAFLLDLAHK